MGKQYLELVAKQVLKLTPFVAIVSSWLNHLFLDIANFMAQIATKEASMFPIALSIMSEYTVSVFSY